VLSHRYTRLRATVLALTAALTAVLALDATTIIAAPATTADSSLELPAALTPPSGLRLLHWSGQTWVVTPENQPGPEAHVHMTDSSSAVYVDSKGRLHLKIIKVNGVWRSVQLMMLGQPAYGTYRWVVRGTTAKFSKNTVLGLFVYESTGTKFANEIDIEDSRFTDWIHPNDAQYIVQPYYGYQHWCPYRSPRSVSLESQAFTWQPGKVSFVSRRGTATNGPAETVHCDFSDARRLGGTAAAKAKHVGKGSNGTRRSFSYAGADVPAPSRQRIFINLWTNRNRPPTGGTHSIVIDSFSFTPAG